MISPGMDFEDGEDEGEEINSGEELFRRLVEAIGEVCEERGDLTKFQIVGCLECVKLTMIEGIQPCGGPETKIDVGGNPADN